jgi:hypothetical protein
MPNAEVEIQFSEHPLSVPYGHWVVANPAAKRLFSEVNRDPGALTRLAAARAKQRELFAHLERLGEDAFGSIAMSHPSHSGKIARYRGPDGSAHSLVILGLVTNQVAGATPEPGHVVQIVNDENFLSTMVVTKVSRISGNIGLYAGYAAAALSVLTLMKFTPSFLRGIRAGFAAGAGELGEAFRQAYQQGRSAVAAVARAGGAPRALATASGVLTAVTLVAYAVEGILELFHRMTTAVSVWNVSGLDLEWSLSAQGPHTEWMNRLEPGDEGRWFPFPAPYSKEDTSTVPGLTLHYDAVAALELALANAPMGTSNSAHPIDACISVRLKGASSNLFCLVFHVPLVGNNRMDAREGDGSMAFLEQAGKDAPDARNLTRSFLVDGLPVQVGLGADEVDGKTSHGGVEGYNYTLGVTISRTRYRIFNRLSGQVLTISAEGRAIQMEASNDAADQVWLLHRRDGDQFELVHEATRKVLDVDTAGRFAQVWSRNQGTNQRWLLEPAEGSWMRIRSVANQEVLDVKGYSTEAGTRVITYPAKLRGNQNPAYNGFENQLWVLREVQ